MMSRPVSHNVRQTAENPQQAGYKVYLGGLNYRWTEQDIYRFMSRYGHILHVTIAKHSNGDSKGYGFVTFATQEEAESAHGTVNYQNKIVVIKPSNKNPTKVSNLDSKENVKLFQQKEFQPEEQFPSLESTSPFSLSGKKETKKSTALSKHSQNFTSASSIKALQARDSEQILVKIINLSTLSHETHSIPPATETSSPTGNRNPQLGLRTVSEKQCQISKHSKEFHPKMAPVSSDFGSIIGGHPAVYPTLFPQGSIQFGHLTTLQKEKPSQEMSMPINNARLPADTKLKPTVAAAITIKFFTFPGRE